MRIARLIVTSGVTPLVANVATRVPSRVARALLISAVMQAARWGVIAVICACGGSEESVDPNAPTIASFTTSAEPLLENGSVTFTAVVTDPQGPTDIASGTLRSLSVASYGTFVATSAGTYSLAVDWAAIQRVQSIDGDASGEQRDFIAEFVDLAGHKTTESLTLTLACKPSSVAQAPCGGVCRVVENDANNCGGCNRVCPGATSNPLSPVSFCRAALCQEVRLTFPERISCEQACRSRGGTCDHDNVCPGSRCDLDEQSYASYSGGIQAPLGGCSAVPPAMNGSSTFQSLGCNCKDLPAM